MNKIVLIILAIILIGGGAFFFMNKDQKSQESAEKKMTQDVMEKGSDAVSGAMGDVMNKIQSGVKMQCTYEMNTEDTGKATSIVSVEGDKYRSVTTVDGIEQHALFDGEDFYSWNTQTKTGFKMNKQCMENLQGEPVEEDELDETEMKDYYESAKDLIADFPDIACEKTNDIDLTLPNDIKFVDQCEILKEQQKMLKEMEAGTMDMEEFMQGMPGMEELQKMAPQ